MRTSWEENKDLNHFWIIAVKARQTGHEWFMGTHHRKKPMIWAKPYYNSGTRQKGLTSDTHPAILLNADFYIYFFQNGWKYLNGNKLGVRWNRAYTHRTRMEMRENVEGQMRMDIMDREESRMGGVSVPKAGPCWARRRTAGPASAA